MAIVHLRLLGGLEIRNHRGDTIDLHVKKVMALFAYLATQPESHFLREQIAQIFWPNTTPKHSRHSLRQALADLRKHLPEFDGIFNITYNTIDLIPGSLSVDINEYIDACKQHDLPSQQRAYQLYQGQFLNDFTIRSEPFLAWQEETRLNLHQRYIQVTEFLAEQNLLQGNTDKAIELNEQLVLLDPIRESAHRCLMSLYANAGQTDAVDSQYQYCCDMLEQKLNVKPEERTISYYHRIKQRLDSRTSSEVSNNNNIDNPIIPAATGRQKELAKIAALLNDFKNQHQSHCLLVHGGLGMGKSWLLEQCRDIAKQTGLETASTRFFDISCCHENGIRDLLIDVIKPEASLADNEIPGLIADHYFKHSTKYDIYLAILYIIFELPIPKRCQRTYSILSPANREQLHTKIIVEILSQVALQEKQVLVFDDIHHADSMVLSILYSLIDLTATGNEDTTTSLFLILASDEATTITEHVDTNSQLSSIVLDEIPIAELKPQIFLKSEKYKSDLLYLNWARYLESTGITNYTDDLNSVLVAAMSQLDNNDLEALHACAVLGMRFSPDALNSLIDNPHYDPGVLIKIGFIFPNRQLLEFSHFLTQQSIYLHIDEKSRKLLHSRAASYYLFGNNHLHAYHLEAAGGEGTTKAYISAAIAASGEYRLNSATYFFEKAFNCARSNQDKYFTTMQQAEAFLDSGRISNAIQLFGQAQHLSDAPQQQAHAWLGMAIGLIQRKQYPAAKGLLERSEPILVCNQIPENPDHKPPYHETLAKFYYYRCLAALHTSSMDDAIRFNKIALEHAKQCQSSFWLSNTALIAGKLEMEGLDLTHAYTSLEFAMRTARGKGHGYVELQAMLALAYVKLLQADFTGSARDLEHIISLASLVEDHHIMLEVLTVLCISDFIKGQFNRMLQHIELATELYSRIDSPHTDYSISNYRLLAEHHLGRPNNVGKLTEDQLSWNYAPIMALIEQQNEAAAHYLDKALREIEHLNGPTKLVSCLIAIEAAIKHRLWEQAENLADIIIMALHDEPLPLFVMSAERVRILSRIDQEQITHSTRTELVDILTSAKHYGLTIHLPAYENALEALRHGKQTV